MELESSLSNFHELLELLKLFFLQKRLSLSRKPFVIPLLIVVELLLASMALSAIFARH